MREKTSYSSFLKLVVNAASLLYAFFLVYIFFFARRRWHVPLSRIVNLDPFKEKLYYLHIHGTKFNADNAEFYKDVIGNVGIFIPLPFLLHYVLGVKSLSRLFLLCIGTSLGVEIIQFILNIGVADVDDLILNTLGTSIGIALMAIHRFFTLRGGNRGR